MNQIKLIIKFTMANCSIYGCHSTRRPEYAGIGIYKVPSGNDEFEKNCREKLEFIITKDRVMDEPLRKRIERRKLYIYIYVRCIII